MHKLILSLGILVILSCLACSSDDKLNGSFSPQNPPVAKFRVEDLLLQEGDLIFQQTSGFQGQLFEEMSQSLWTHVGVLREIAKDWYVTEAQKSVTRTEITKFVARGKNQAIIIARVKPSYVDLSKTENQAKFISALGDYMARPYDDYFEWSDARIYCSELVWKAFSNAFGKPLSVLKKLKDYRLDGPIASRLIAEYERETGQKVNFEETVVGPDTILASGALQIIYKFE